jgi:hypothetical protein
MSFTAANHGDTETRRSKTPKISVPLCLRGFVGK